MRSMRGTPMGWRPTRPPVGFFGSIKASSRAKGTTCSCSPRNFSRRVTRFFWVNSLLVKLNCLEDWGGDASWAYRLQESDIIDQRFHRGCSTLPLPVHKAPTNGRQAAVADQADEADEYDAR